jgi:hypothetical protein
MRFLARRHDFEYGRARSWTREIQMYIYIICMYPRTRTDSEKHNKKVHERMMHDEYIYRVPEMRTERNVVTYRALHQKFSWGTCRTRDTRLVEIERVLADEPNRFHRRR